MTSCATIEPAMSQRLVKRIRDRLAKEQGTVHKDWGGRIPIALIYPNAYAVGMSNLGFLTVYRLLNDHEDIVCERAFVPDRDGPAEQASTPRTETAYLSMESQRRLSEFEILAFSVSYENDYPNIIEIVRGSGVPVLREARRTGTVGYPLLIAGGPAVFLNPEPLADVMDCFLLGEAEALLGEFLDVYRDRRYAPRSDLVRALCSVEGVYVPELYEPRYDGKGMLVAFDHAPGAPERVRRRRVENLGAFPTSAAITTPETEFGRMFLVEIGRGCGRRCPFCATGQIYHPVRYRSPASLEGIIAESIGRGDEAGSRFGLVCASLGDYPHLPELYELIRRAGGTISAPSIRIDTLDDRMLAMLADSGQKTITVALEAGTERVRKAVGKDISNQAVLETIDRLASFGIFGVRLYFMVGLPGEKDEDIDAIVGLVRQIRHRFLAVAKSTARMGEITLSVNPFVPKPWSPFQWCPMEEEAVLKERLKRIHRGLDREPNVHVTHALPKWAYLQALLSRGDRRVGMFLHAEESFPRDFKRAFRALNINPDFYVYRRRQRDELFPWDFIDQGVSKDTLYRDYEKAMGYIGQ